MTIGQRIAQLRKEKGLSQKRLGEELGVSRQAISKWEADGAIPEVDKLIALSRLFGTSVGYLLGVEEEPAARQEDAPSGQDADLVEQVLRRYVAAQPKPPGRPRWLWPAAIAAAAALLLAGSALFENLEEMHGQVADLRNQVGQLQYDVDADISSITRRVEEALATQASLLTGYEVQAEEMDIAAGTISLRLEATPKTVEDGLVMEFLASDGTNTCRAPLQPGEGPVYTALLEVPLADGLRYYVSFQWGDRTETEELSLPGEYSSLSRAAVLEVEFTAASGSLSLTGGSLTLKDFEAGAFVYSPSSDLGEAFLWPESAVLRLYRGEDMVEEFPMETQERSAGKGYAIYSVFLGDRTWEADGPVCLEVAVTDNYGREFVSQPEVWGEGAAQWEAVRAQEG